MFHFAVRSAPYTLLFRTWEEGLALWSRLVTAVPGAVAICVMPDHIHVQHPRDVTAAIRRAMRAYARWRNHHRGESGPVWQGLDAPTVATNSLKRWRDEKYVHKNPCRAHLTDAPLAWPLSTYRDALGLALQPVRKRAPDPAAYHRKTCKDDHVRYRELPFGQADAWGNAGLPAVADAVSALARVSSAAIHRRGAPRALFVRAARVLTDVSVGEIAEYVGVTRRQVFRMAAHDDAEVTLVARVLGDARFVELGPGDLSRDPAWARYARERRLNR